MLNSVCLQGRVCADPELRYTAGSQLPVTSFTLAVDRDFARGDERAADFIDVVCWRKTAEFVCQWFRRGSAAVVHGRLQVRDYKDRNGDTRRTVEVVADSVYFGESRKADAETPPPPTEPTKKTYYDPRPKAVNVDPSAFEDLGSDDGGELPF